MSNFHQQSGRGPLDPTAPRAPERWVWVAGVIIVALACYGLYRGVTGVRAGEPSLLLAAPAVGGPAPVDAAQATALPHDDQWSTLSGPKVLPPPAPKAAKVADDSADDSGAPADNSAADAADEVSQTDAATAAPKPPPDASQTPPPAPTEGQ